MVNGHIPFDVYKWMSRHLGPTVVDLNNKIGTLMIGSTEKGWLKPVPKATNLAFEKKLEQRFQKLKNKPINTLHCEVDPVKTKQMSLLALDQAKSEHVHDRCWVFFTTWCKSCPRYKQIFRNGYPSAEEIALQRDCSRNG